MQLNSTLLTHIFEFINVIIINVISAVCCVPRKKPGTELVQALTDILHLALCCHSNKTRAPIANPPNSAQLGCNP